MSDDTRDRELSTAFFFGVRLYATTLGEEQPAAVLFKVIELLQEVASGETTIIESPADFPPGLAPELRTVAEEHADAQVRQDRVLAAAILRTGIA